MTISRSKKMAIETLLMIFTFTVVSSFAWGNRQDQGKGMGQGLQTNYNATYGKTDTGSVNGNAQEMKGRDFVRLGKLYELNGTLELVGTEWFLTTGDNTYALHMGPETYRESKGFSLSEGNLVTINGFVYNDDIAIKYISSNGQSIVLRDETGRPTWAGSKFSNRQASN